MRILVIYRINIDDTSLAGIKAKMEGQVNALKKSHSVDLICLSDKSLLLNNQPIKHFDNWYLNKLSKFKVFYKKFYCTIQEQLQLDDYDLVYIRYHAAYHQFYTFLKSLKAKVVLEIPTYPYDKEFSKWWQTFQLSIDKKYRNKLFPYVTRIVHFGPNKEIYQIPTFRMTNGISIPENVTLAEHKHQEPFTMIAIGKWQFWHGLERVIKGLSEYKGNLKIRLIIVGHGPYTEHYKKLVAEENVEHIVEFFPSLDGGALDILIKQAHIGIGSLAHHRKDLEEVSALKHRRYCLHGIPFVHASYDRDFPKDLVYSYEIPADESIVNINDVINFYKNLPSGFPKLLLEYAKENLSWEKKLDGLLEDLDS